LALPGGPRRRFPVFHGRSSLSERQFSQQTRHAAPAIPQKNFIISKNQRQSEFRPFSGLRITRQKIGVSKQKKTIGMRMETIRQKLKGNG
jgi:hypothetical protein